jgi:hypothetical protein
MSKTRSTVVLCDKYDESDKSGYQLSIPAIAVLDAHPDAARSARGYKHLICRTPTSNLPDSYLIPVVLLTPSVVFLTERTIR